jgi:beta-ring hydroxylase
MINLFGQATDRLCKKLDAAASDGKDVEMESLFSRLTLDIIGKAVFNYDFDSLTNDTGIVEVFLCSPTLLSSVSWSSVLQLPSLFVKSAHLMLHIYVFWLNQAVYTVLREAEDRSVAPIPFWEIPIWKDVSPRQRKVASALKLINDILDDLIAICKVRSSTIDSKWWGMMQSATC